MELNTPVTNPDLIAAMDAFIAKREPQSEIALILTLDRARLMAPVTLSEPPVDGTLKAGTQVQNYVINNKKGEKFFMAFTSEEEFKKWAGQEKRDYLITSSYGYKAILAQAPREDIKGYVIDPFGRNFALTREMIQRHDQIRAAVRASLMPRMKVAVPAEDPTELRYGLKKIFRKKKMVAEAWLFLATPEDPKVKVPPRFLVVADIDDDVDDLKALFKEIKEEAETYLEEGQALDLVRRTDNFSPELLEKNDPFYRRKTGLFW